MREAGERTKSYETQEDIARVPRILAKGTYWLHRDAGTYTFVFPPNEGEILENGDDSLYLERVRRASIDPFFERAVDRAVSALFNKPIQLKDDVSPAIAGNPDDDKDGLWANIDGKGNRGDEFFRRVAWDSIGDRGMSGVLVEFPKTPDGATLADLGNRMPYLVHYRGRDILHAEPGYVLGKERVKELWLRESSRMSEDGEHKRERQLVAPPADEEGRVEGFVTYTLWEQEKPENDESWVVIEEGQMLPHREIPFTVYYTGWEGFFQASTPFLQLAYRNLLHTKLESADIENLVISSGAQLFRGILDDSELDQRAIGPRSMMYSKLTPDMPTPIVEWKERSGSASEMMRRKLEGLEARMTQLGNEVHMKRQPGNETATGKAIDTAEARTETEAWSMALKDFIETVLGFLAVYPQVGGSGGTVVVSPPPRFSERDVQSVEKAMEMREKGILHPEDEAALAMILTVAKEVFNWPEEFSPEDTAAENIRLGVLVPGGLETVQDARTRNPLPMVEEPGEPMPPMAGDDEEAA